MPTTLAERRKLLPKVRTHGFGHEQLAWLEEFHDLLWPVRVTYEVLLDAALGQPDLFQRSPQALKDNAVGSSELLRITRKQFVEACLKQPSLFGYKPETLNMHVRRSSKLLGVRRKSFIQAALEHPPLFYQPPKTLEPHSYFIKRILEACGAEQTFDQFMIRYPRRLSLSNTNLLGRDILAQTGTYTIAGNLFSMPKEEVQSRLIEQYQDMTVTHQKTGKPFPAGNRMLQTLHHIGVLDALPEGIKPLSDKRSLPILNRLLEEKEARKYKPRKR